VGPVIVADTLPSWFWPAIGAIAAVAVIFGGALPSIRTSRAKETIALQAAELDAERTARIAQQSRCDAEMRSMDQRHSARMNEIERRHASEIGELRGRITAMTPEFAKAIAHHLREEGV
jgi:hypothetical protein